MDEIPISKFKAACLAVLEGVRTPGVLDRRLLAGSGFARLAPPA